MNETFKIRENGFDEIKKQLIIKSISFSLLALSFGFAIVYFNSGNKEDLYMSLPFSLPILIIALLFGLRTGFRRQKNIFETYKLVFL
ncbi:hypothetical protein [Flavobacterium sp.]|uniref:hypothetical protein n=1 Tax=Flavobacterium sp. TaxID=239 RepID=UPI0031D2ED43